MCGSVDRFSLLQDFFLLTMQVLGNILRTARSRFWSRNISSWQIALNEHGEPLDVLYNRVVDIGPLKNREVLVNYRLCPINPSDINAIQGTYPMRPALPAVAGNEGAGYVNIPLIVIHVRFWNVDPEFLN